MSPEQKRIVAMQAAMADVLDYLMVNAPASALEYAVGRRFKQFLPPDELEVACAQQEESDCIVEWLRGPPEIRSAGHLVPRWMTDAVAAAIERGEHLIARIEVAKPSRQLAGSTVGESRNSSNPSPNTSPYNPHQEEG